MNLSNLSYMNARIQTSLGTIDVELFSDLTPTTANNFVSLAESGFYNNLVWHRIVRGFVIQTGDPNSRNAQGDQSRWGEGGSEKSIRLEINSKLHHVAGTLGVARAPDPDSGSSQFFINLRDNASLDGKYTVFGKVTGGMDTVSALGNLPVNGRYNPLNPSEAMMISVKIDNSPKI